MTDRHKAPPVSVRLSQSDRDWLAEYARQLRDPQGKPATIHGLIVLAVQEYREREDVFCPYVVEDAVDRYEPSGHRYRRAG